MKKDKTGNGMVLLRGTIVSLLIGTGVIALSTGDFIAGGISIGVAVFLAFLHFSWSE